MFEHIDLVFITYHTNLHVSEKIVSRCATDVVVNLSSYFFQEDEVRFDDQLHLNFVELDCFLLIFVFLIFLLTEVVDLLEELLIFLKIVLKLVDCLLRHFVEFVLSFVDRSCSLGY